MLRAQSSHVRGHAEAGSRPTAVPGRAASPVPRRAPGPTAGWLAGWLEMLLCGLQSMCRQTHPPGPQTMDAAWAWPRPGHGHGCTGVCPLLWHGVTVEGLIVLDLTDRKGTHVDVARGGAPGKSTRHAGWPLCGKAPEASSFPFLRKLEITPDPLTASRRHRHSDGRFLI